jgi:hypothetical protein
MHGLNTIKRLNRTEQDFVDHILATPTPEVNLLQVWQEWKEQEQVKPCLTLADSEKQSAPANSTEHVGH